MLPKLLRQLSMIRLEYRLEHRIVHDKVRIQLEQILLIELQRRLLHIYGIADLLICLQKLPQLIAYPVVAILHQKVRPLYRTAHLLTSVHQLAECAVFQSHGHTPHAIDTHEDIHIVAVIFGEALQIFYSHLDLIVYLLVCIVHMT